MPNFKTPTEAKQYTVELLNDPEGAFVDTFHCDWCGQEVAKATLRSNGGDWFCSTVCLAEEAEHYWACAEVNDD